MPTLCADLEGTRGREPAFQGQRKRLAARSTLSVGSVDGGTVQATRVLLAAQTLFDNRRVNPGVRGSPTEQSVEQNDGGHRN